MGANRYPLNNNVPAHLNMFAHIPVFRGASYGLRYFNLCGSLLIPLRPLRNICLLLFGSHAGYKF